MSVARRNVLTLALAGLVARGHGARAQAAMQAAPGPAASGPAAPGLAAAMAERSLGDPKAKVTVQEFFSMTCSHCAAFSREVMPEITAKLIDTGKLRFVYHDYPLDQIALVGAIVARTLPAARYEPFVSALFAAQDRWAFNPDGGNSTEALARMAALAGLSRPQFDAAVADDALKQAILNAQKEATDLYKIDSTPTFWCNGKTHSGEMNFADFTAFAGVTA